MTFTTHLLTGAAIGAATGNIPAAFVGGVASHFILDIIPHIDAGWIEIQPNIAKTKWSKKLWTAVIVDVAVGTLLFTLATPPSVHALPLVAGGIGGLFPDLFDNVPFWRDRWHATKIGAWLYGWHDKTHFIKLTRKKGVHILFAMVTQLAVLGWALYTLGGAILY